MRLEISNFAKIGYADLDFNGITVIAGLNNTGKTTVGKILYSIFNSFCNIDRKVDDTRKAEIHLICTKYLRRPMRMGYTNSENERVKIFTMAKYRETCSNVTEALCFVEPEEFSYEKLVEILKTEFDNNFVFLDDYKSELEDLYDKLAIVIKTDKDKLECELVYRFFDMMFASQIQTLKAVEKDARLTLMIKNKLLDINISADEIKIGSNINIMHEAYFIDNPFVLDELRSDSLISRNDIMGSMLPNRILIDKIKEYEDTEGSIYDVVYAKEKIAELMSIINAIVPGAVSSKSGKWAVSSTYYDKPVDFYNLSAGLKSFVLLKMLLTKGVLKEKDVLILDEPEIHLHPEWQLKYAEIIVLLQKLFDLTIVVSTHSRDFFEAIDLYSQKYNVNDNCKYYLAKQVDGISTFEDVTKDTSKIYGHLINPTMMLDKLRFELEDKYVE